MGCVLGRQAGADTVEINQLKNVSTYRKKGAQNFINSSDILYIDSNKKRVAQWSQFTGLQLPVNSQSYNSTNSISDSFRKSNTKNLILDRDYMQAVESGDEQEQLRLVEQAAKEWGAFSDGKPEPIKFYHGTKSFGFTEFDLRKIGDGRSIFLTSDLETAQSYSGSFDKRKIKETFGRLSLDDTVKKLNHIYKDVYAFKIAGSGMQVEINESGIEETFNYQNFKRHSDKLKLLKLATIWKVPDIIKSGKLIGDDEKNYHNPQSTVKYAYIEGEAEVYGVPYKVKISVRKSLQKNKFWVHQISVAEKKNAAFDLPAGENSKTGYRAKSDNERVSQSGDNVKNLVYDYSADDRIREQEAELIDKLNSLYDRIDE